MNNSKKLLLGVLKEVKMVRIDCEKLEKRIETLEQGYPNKEELKKIKIGGTD